MDKEHRHNAIKVSATFILFDVQGIEFNLRLSGPYFVSLFGTKEQCKKQFPGQNTKL